MLVSTLFDRINSALRGIDDEVPTEGGAEATYWLGITNRKKDEWATDPFENWSSLFSTNANETGTVATTGTTTLTGTGTVFTNFSVGDLITVDGETVRTIDTITSDTVLNVTVAFTNTASGKTFTRSPVITASVQTYNLHSRLIRPTDEVFVTTTANENYYSPVVPQSRNSASGTVYISGINPKQLTFNDTISTGNTIIGGTLSVPGLFLPEDMTAFTDTVPVDDPNWLALAVAAEIAFADVTYEDKMSDLTGMANNLYTRMKAANKKGTITTPRALTTKVKRIGSQER